MAEFETFIHQLNGKYMWFVISDCNNHVLAQGCVKTLTTAQRQANEASLLLKAGLYMSGSRT